MSPEGRRPPRPESYVRLKGQVLRAISSIPRGSVTTYSAIAQGLDIGPRRVAYVLSREPAAARVPWHRVVASGGKISIPDRAAKAEQARRLRREGIDVRAGRIVRFAAVFLAP